MQISVGYFKRCGGVGWVRGGDQSVLPAFYLKKIFCVCESLCVYIVNDVSYCSQGPKCLKGTDMMLRLTGHYCENCIGSTARMIWFHTHRIG